ncbi:DNA cytosine methyltransferase [Ralstonia nicotianae]|uniref:DNA (cytosine-5-)-methyltransferase n=1 Tax=Ralstonia solanacearum TaxID=305 RepID=A0A0S4WFX6_RALSL|nr:DNA-methyltransferase Dcm [Ralstonia solanacearum]
MRTFIDLFCGGGLGARGAVQAGMTPLVAVDLWNIACETYKANFPGTTVLNERIELLDPLRHCRPGELDLLLASPECTNHSVAKGAAPRDERSRETALHTVDWIAALRPTWFIIENVKEMRAWSRYNELLDLLRALGYQLREEVINAADFGAPQARVRLFLIGGLNIEPPVIQPADGTVARTVRDILDPDGTWPMSPVFTERRAAATKERARDAINELGNDAEFLVVYYGSGGTKSWQTLDEPLRTITTLDRFALVKKQSNRWKMRMLQPSELARAMSLPPAHVFPVGSRRERVKVCGNGVCAVVVERIVQQLREVTPQQLGETPPQRQDRRILQVAP